MSETQNIEYKSSRHEEYLDWIFGFSNVQVGKIFFGKDILFCNFAKQQRYDQEKIIGTPAGY